MTDSEIVSAIHALMDGQEWNAGDLCQDIAAILGNNGYPIREPEDAVCDLTITEVANALVQFDDGGSVLYEQTGGGVGTLYLKTLRVPATFAIGPFSYHNGKATDDALYVGFDGSDVADDCTTIPEIVAAIHARLNAPAPE
jgi:hypothetical protein